jgi:hypothetical protein
VIYPFWLIMFFNGQFLIWTAGLLAVLAVLANFFVRFDKDLVAQGIIVVIAAAAIVFYVLRWAREFLIRMIVDYDANNGDGRVIIQRFVPSPNEPEFVQFPLQQAAEGSPEINTRGLFNTIVTQLKIFNALRTLTIGDLTLRGPAAPFGLTMRNIRDPAGVKAKLDKEWKRIAALKAKEKAKHDREEEINRMRTAVVDGIVEALKKPELQSIITPPPSPAAPVSMEWTPAGALRPQDVPAAARIPNPANPDESAANGNGGEIKSHEEPTAIIPPDDESAASLSRLVPPRTF